MTEVWQRQASLWNPKTEDGQIVRTVDKPHQAVLKILGLKDEDISNALQFPATRREILNRLQPKVVVFPDRIELDTVFPLQVIECKKCNSIFVLGAVIALQKWKMPEAANRPTNLRAPSKTGR